MTNPNIERDKVERGKGTHPLYDEIEALQSNLADMTGQRDWWQQECEEVRKALTVSEKRAGTAEQLAEDWQCEYDKVIDERDSARSSLMRVREALKPFAAFADHGQIIPDNSFITVGSNMARKQLTMGQCREAYSTLQASGDRGP